MKLSLDKIVFLLKYPHGKIEDIKAIPYLTELKDCYSLGDKKFYSSNYLIKDKIYISFNPRVQDSDDFPVDCVRFEFNPNKFDIAELGWYLSLFPSKEYIKYNRVDFAYDVKKHILPQFFYDKNKRNTHYYFCGGDCETAYLGSQLSDIQYRIYDKRKEVLKSEKLTSEKVNSDQTLFDYLKENYGFDINYPLYRIEVQLRKNILTKIDKNFWSGLCYYDCPDYSPEAVNCPISNHKRFFLSYAKEFGIMPALKVVEPNRRKTYQNLMKVSVYDDLYQNSISQFFAYDKKIKHLIGNDIYE